MAAVTQDEIDEAVLIGKRAVYLLANEIAIEQKYGGKTTCCKKRLKLIYTLLQPLLCVEISNSFYIFSSIGTPGALYQLYINNIFIAEYTAPANNNGSIEAAVAIANEFSNDYTFETIEIPGQDVYGIKMIGGCENFVIKIINDKGQSTSFSSYGGHCLDCLNNETIKKLIGKIRAFCTT